MLSGKPPVNGRSHDEIQHRIAHHDPVPLRRLDPTIPRDLEEHRLQVPAKGPSRAIRLRGGAFPGPPAVCQRGSGGSPPPAVARAVGSESVAIPAKGRRAGGGDRARVGLGRNLVEESKGGRRRERPSIPGNGDPSGKPVGGEPRALGDPPGACRGRGACIRSASRGSWILTAEAAVTRLRSARRGWAGSSWKPALLSPTSGPNPLTDAVDQLHRTIAEFPNKPDAYYYLARGLLLQGHIEEANRALEKLLSIDRAFVGVLNLQVMIAATGGNGAGAAKQAVDSAAALPAGRWANNWVEAHKALDEGRWAEAVAKFGELIEVRDVRSRVLRGLARRGAPATRPGAAPPGGIHGSAGRLLQGGG